MLDSEGTRQSAEVVEQLCDRHAATWGVLAQWLSAAADDEAALEDEFVAELARVETALTADYTAIDPRQNDRRRVATAGLGWVEEAEREQRPTRSGPSSAGGSTGMMVGS